MPVGAKVSLLNDSVDNFEEKNAGSANDSGEENEHDHGHLDAPLERHRTLADLSQLVSIHFVERGDEDA